MPTGVQDRGRRWTQLNASQDRIEVDAPLGPLPLEVPVGAFRLLDARVAELVSSADAADRIAYGILVAALEEGLVRTLRDAVNVLKRFSTPAGMLGEDWLSEQENTLGERG